MLENEAAREAGGKTANRTGSLGHGAVDADEGVVATSGARGGSYECDFAELSTETGSQYLSCAHRSWSLRSVIVATA